MVWVWDCVCGCVHTVLWYGLPYHSRVLRVVKDVAAPYHQTLLSLLSRYYYRRYRTRLHTARLRRYITHGHYCLKHTQKLCVKKLSFRDFLILRFEVKHSDTVSLFWSLFTVNILHSFSRFLSINIWFSSYYKTTVIYYKLLPLLPVHLEYTQLHAHTLITTCFAINTI